MASLHRISKARLIIIITTFNIYTRTNINFIILEYIHGICYSAILKYALAAFQYKNPTVRLSILRKLIKII